MPNDVDKPTNQPSSDMDFGTFGPGGTDGGKSLDLGEIDRPADTQED